MPNDEEYDIEIPLDQRLRKYGLQVDDVSREDLVVEGSQELTRENAPDVHLLEPDTLEELNAWIGVDNEEAPAIHPHELPSYRPSSFSEIESSLGDASEDGAQLVRDLEGVLGRYLMCDSRTCPEWTDIIQDYINNSSHKVGIVTTKTIHIKENSTFSVKDDVNVLFSDYIKIENNGTLKYDGGLKIDTSIIEGMN